MMKYAISFFTIIVSYLANTISIQYFYIWIPLAVISGFYSFYWDLKYDWGLLEKDVKLFFSNRILF